jgi:hypothetical protein
VRNILIQALRKQRKQNFAEAHLVQANERRLKYNFRGSY